MAFSSAVYTFPNIYIPFFAEASGKVEKLTINSEKGYLWVKLWKFMDVNILFAK